MTSLVARFRFAAVLLIGSLLVAPLSFGQTSGVCYNSGKTSRCAGAQGLVMATPAGGAGQATLRALAASDLPPPTTGGSELRFSSGGPLVMGILQSAVVGPNTTRVGAGVAPLPTDSSIQVGVALSTTTIRINLVNGAPAGPGDQGRIILYESTNSGVTYTPLTLMQFNVNPSNAAVTASANFFATLNPGNQYLVRFDLLGGSAFNGAFSFTVF